MADNKQRIRAAFEAMGESDTALLVAMMADDFSWAIEGQSRFSRRYDGKDVVRNELLRPLFEAFATPYRFRIEEIIAEADRVVVLGHGEVRTKWGRDYNNRYCFVVRMKDGLMTEIREYLDTALVESVFGDAPRRSAG